MTTLEKIAMFLDAAPVSTTLLTLNLAIIPLCIKNQDIEALGFNLGVALFNAFISYGHYRFYQLLDNSLRKRGFNKDTKNLMQYYLSSRYGKHIAAIVCSKHGYKHKLEEMIHLQKTT